MKISDLLKIEGVELVQPEFEDGPVSSGYTSDLLSDVMGNAKEDCVLLTIQSHKNTVAVAGLVGARAILICNRRPVPDDMKIAAAAEKIAVFVTADNQFEASCKVKQLLSAG